MSAGSGNAKHSVCHAVCSAKRSCHLNSAGLSAYRGYTCLRAEAAIALSETARATTRQASSQTGMEKVLTHRSTSGHTSSCKNSTGMERNASHVCQHQFTQILASCEDSCRAQNARHLQTSMGSRLSSSLSSGHYVLANGWNSFC